jgi:hypothetical protein
MLLAFFAFAKGIAQSKTERIDHNRPRSIQREGKGFLVASSQHPQAGVEGQLVELASLRLS